MHRGPSPACMLNAACLAVATMRASRSRHGLPAALRLQQPTPALRLRRPARGRGGRRLETRKRSWKRRCRVGIACRVDRTTMAMSSAYAWIRNWSPVCLSRRRNRSTTTAKSSGDSGQPCRIPTCWWNRNTSITHGVTE